MILHEFVCLPFFAMVRPCSEESGMEKPHINEMVHETNNMCESEKIVFSRPRIAGSRKIVFFMFSLPTLLFLITAQRRCIEHRKAAGAPNQTANQIQPNTRAEAVLG